jgi:beta-glucanase (GH16 family)
LPYALTLDQEFDGPAGAIDPTVWTFDVGAGGWGNGELEYYTARTQNAQIDGNGNLQIIARAESFMGSSYTSARINTSAAFTQAYGRFEARIKMPQGKAIWPAFWSLGNNAGAGWPGRGELDIMETFNDFTLNHGSAHGPGYSGGQCLTAQVKAPFGSFADAYYVYAIEWEPAVVRWYVDGTLYETRTPADVPPGDTWVFDHPFFLILNVAIGSYSMGAPDGTVTWPQTMYVDYVRVYQPS